MIIKTTLGLRRRRSDWPPAALFIGKYGEMRNVKSSAALTNLDVHYAVHARDLHHT